MRSGSASRPWHASYSKYTQREDDEPRQHVEAEDSTMQRPPDHAGVHRVFRILAENP